MTTRLCVYFLCTVLYLGDGKRKGGDGVDFARRWRLFVYGLGYCIACVISLGWDLGSDGKQIVIYCSNTGCFPVQRSEEVLLRLQRCAVIGYQCSATRWCDSAAAIWPTGKGQSLNLMTVL